MTGRSSEGKRRRIWREEMIFRWRSKRSSSGRRMLMMIRRRKKKQKQESLGKTREEC